MERFFLNLKMERVWRRDYANHPEAIGDITDYIVGFYNSKRLHSSLGYLPPNGYERKWQNNNLSRCPKNVDHYIAKRTKYLQTIGSQIIFPCRPNKKVASPPAR